MPGPRFPTTLPSFLRTAIAQRELVVELVKSDIAGRYRGSMLGILWSFASPLLLLAAFTFVFGTVFRTRWGGAVTSQGDFALVLFPGILLHAFLAESFNRAPNLVTAMPNYVKKVLFPLDLLPLVAVITSGFHALIGFFVLMVALMFAHGTLPLTAIVFPAIVAPYLVLVLGVTWFLAALGVYLRDIAQVIGLVTMLLMFLSPVFYPASALPEAYRGWLALNPLTLPLEATRGALIWGQWPDWTALGVYTIAAVVVAGAGYWWFQKSRKGFADVL